MSARRRSFFSMSVSAPAAAAAGARDDISLSVWSINKSFFIGRRWKNLNPGGDPYDVIRKTVPRIKASL